MEKRIFVLSLAVFLLLAALCGCAAAPEEAAAPTPTASAEPAPPATPVPTPDPTPRPAYDFSDIEPLPGLADISGFEHSQWGDTMEAVMERELENETMPGSFQFMNNYAYLAGIYFNAYFMFTADAEGTPRLFAGRYYRGPEMLFGNIYPLEDAVSDFDTLYAYFTELYGDPGGLSLRETNEHGFKKVTAVESAYAFEGKEESSILASWTLPVREDSSAGPMVILWMGVQSGDVQIMAEFRDDTAKYR